MHIVSSFLHTNVATLFFELILATTIAKSKVLTQGIVTVGQVYPCIDIFIIIVSIGIACFALKAVLTLPLLWHMGNLRLQTK